MNGQTLLTPHIMAWVEQALPSNARIQTITTLKGATTTTLYKLTISETEALVLRVYDNEDWLKQAPDLARHEAESLKRAAACPTLSVLTPRIIQVDETGRAFGMPAILMSHVPGRVDLAPKNLDLWLKELARALAELHQIDPQHFQWQYGRYIDGKELKVPSWARYPEICKKGIERVKEQPPAYKETFIHRDFHPVNVLWQGEKVSGVVDWVNACRGPAAIDVGHCRVNLVCLFGVEAADAFLTYYRSFAQRSWENDPYWDLVAFFDFAYPGPPEVYEGWSDFGVTGLTRQMIAERLEQYLIRLVEGGHS
ncbi:phosphotransferase family protein [Caenibacillus caldisaponilyticus]|uniref:phosphotransferase family protein n=1 Tax=Caenibacillus caldisaponilyticus TaxID=1674942 RepID=UPI0009888807|nr:aminoglycoside phosphotransferase family protein [Caenibacillus caldisaponilyticus]